MVIGNQGSLLHMASEDWSVFVCPIQQTVYTGSVRIQSASQFVAYEKEKGDQHKIRKVVYPYVKNESERDTVVMLVGRALGYKSKD